MYKILIKELIYSESNSNKYTYLNKGDVHSLELYNVDTIASLIKQGFVVKVNVTEPIEEVIEDRTMEVYDEVKMASLIEQGFAIEIEGFIPTVEVVEDVHADVEDNSLETDVVVDANKKPQVKKPKSKSSEEISE